LLHSRIEFQLRTIQMGSEARSPIDSEVWPSTGPRAARRSSHRIDLRSRLAGDVGWGAGR